LLIDVDGVISLFGFAQGEQPDGAFHWVNGILHLISDGAGERLLRLDDAYELVWATGWEETANEHLPHLLGLGRELPCLSFDALPRFGVAHWKLSAIERYVGSDRPVAWIDDSIDEACHDWAACRPGPTLLIRTHCHVGISDEHVEDLLAWAHSL
jgi:hypothetical protein